MQERNQKFSSSVKGNRYLELKEQRQELTALYIQQGKMADPERKYSLGSAPALVGECLDMCPLFERHEREFQTGGLDKLEKIPGTEHVDHQKAVKRYRRSAAGDPPPLPCDVRPPSVLLKTLDYLIDDVLKNSGLVESYAFVRDRARAIRNDLTLQNYRGKEAVDICERIARYHIITSHELCDVEGISLQQEHEQLRKTLQSLMEFYQEMNEKNIHMPNEAEFQAYYILTHAYANETASKAETLSHNVFYNSQFQFALEVQSFMARTNEEYIQGRSSENGSLNFYTAIFDHLRRPSTSYLMACCIHMNFTDIRRGALKAMQKAFYCFPDDASSLWPLEELEFLLGFDSVEELKETLDYYEIPYQDENAFIGKLVGISEQKMNKGNFTEGQRVSLTQRKSRKLVSTKKEGFSEVDIIQGRVNASVNLAPAKPSLNLFNVQKPQVTHMLTPSAQLPLPSQNSVLSSIPISNSKPQQKKLKIPDEIIYEYTMWLFNQFIGEGLAQDPFLQSLIQNKNRMIDSICGQVVYDLIDQVSNELVTERLRISKGVSLYLNCLESIVADISNDVVTSEICKICKISVSQFESFREHETRYHRFVWDRWTYCLIRRKLRTVLKQKRAEKLLLNLKGFGYATPHKAKRSESSHVTLSHANHQEIDHDLYKPLDILALIAKRNPALTYCKLSFSIPETPTLIQGFDQFLNFWLFSKLARTYNDKSYESKKIGDREFHLVTQSVCYSSILSNLLPNHLSVCSGVNCAVFSLEPYVLDSSSAKYWKIQSDRLFAFVSRFPLQAKVPLLVIYWTQLSTDLISEEDMMSQLGLNFIKRDGPISSCQFLRISADHNHFDSKAISDQLGDKISDLVSRCDMTFFGLHFDISKILGESKVLQLVEDLIIRSQEKLFGIYLDSANIIESREASANSPTMLKSHSRLFIHFITSLNRLIISIQDITTEFPLQCISFPAKEFCDLGVADKIRLDWNSDRSFAEIRLIFSKLLLPVPEYPDAYNKETLGFFYENYTKSAIVESKYKDISVAETRKIIHICAPSEWMTKHISFYARLIFENISQEWKTLHSSFLMDSFSKKMDSYVYDLKKETSLIVEEIIQDLSSTQNLEYSTHFRLARKRYKSTESSPKTADSRKKMKDLVSLAQKEIENIQYKLSQV